MKQVSYTAFDNGTRISSGPLPEIALEVKRYLKKSPNASVLIFNDETGSQVDFDLSGSENDVLSRLKVFIAEKPPVQKGRGRPKLGVVSREISLLPRQWEWLNSQTGGASVTLRKLVEKARKSEDSRSEQKRSSDRTHQVMTALSGDLEGYEETLRALYRKEKDSFQKLTSLWPKDIRTYVRKIAKDAFV